ncbi:MULTISPECIES: T9SS type B sorting domain-containing protein [Flavobacterium]|nr:MULTISPECIES: T9SS type B sorting domain-containing protein [Flavobacterium]
MKRILYLFLLIITFNNIYSQSPTCDTASAICSGSVAPFPNSTGVASLGTIGCLNTTPNPAWFYFQVGTSGNFNFSLHQGNNAPAYNNQDVDFIVWGPFTGPNCTDLFEYSPGATVNNIAACSYSVSAVENFSLNGVNAGEFYVLLVTNFSNNPGFIQLDLLNSSTATTDCDIVCGVDLGPDQLFCSSTITSTTLTATFNQAPTTPGTPTYEWYLGTPAVLQTTTTTNSLTVSQSGTWEVRVTRPGCSDVATDQVDVYFSSPPVLNTPPDLIGAMNDCAPVYDLTSVIPAMVAPENPADFNVSFYLDLFDSFSGGTTVPTYIANPTAYTPNPLADTTIYVRVEDVNNSACAEFIEFQVIINCGVIIVQPSDMVVCDDPSNDDFEIFDLTSQDATVIGSNNPALYDITYYTSQAGADDYTVTTTDAATPYAAFNGTNQVIYVRIQEIADPTVYNTTTFNLVVTPTPVLTSLSGTGPICAGEDAIFTLVGTANATVTYTLDGGSTTDTVVLDASGNGTVTVVGAMINQMIELSSISVGSCVTPLTNTATITVNPLPAITSLTTNSPICAGEDAIFTIVGTPDAVVDYTLNTVAQSINLDALGNGTITVTAATVDQTVALTLITNPTTTCSLVVTDTATITVNPLPTVTSLTTNSPICAGEDAIFTIVGTPDGVVDYTDNTGAQSITLDASGNGVVTIIGALVDQTITLSLITNPATTCSSVVTNTAIITVNPLPVLTSLSGNGPICAGEDAIFTVVGTPDAVVDYTLNTVAQSITLDALGNGTIIVTAAAVDQTVALTLITNPTTTCSLVVTDTATITVNPLPTVTSLTTNSPICAGEDAVFTIVGTPDAVVDYTDNIGAKSITLDGSGNGVVTIVGALVDQTITLSLITNPTTTCSSVVTDATTITVVLLPVLTSLSGNGPICAGEDAIFTLDGTANATVTYTLDGGTTTDTVILDASGNGTVTVVGAMINQMIELSSISVGSCVSSLTDTETIIVNPLPTITSLTTNGPICAGEDAIFTIVGTPDAVVDYTLNTVAQSITLDALGNGTITVTVATVDQTVALTLITNPTTTCSSVVTDTATITVNPLPTVTSLTTNSPICEGEDAIFTLVGTPDAVVDYTDNTGAQSITLDASGNGVVTIVGALVDQTITLSLITNPTTTCSSVVTNTATITVNPLPVLTSLSGNGPICAGSDAIFTIVGTPDAVVDYTLNTVAQSITLDALGNGTITVTAATVDQTIGLTLITNPTTTCSLVVTDTATITVNPLPTVTSLTTNSPICEGEDAIFTIVGTPDATVSYTITGVVATQTVLLDASGNGIITVTAATTDQTVTLSFIENTTTNCISPLTNTATIVVNAIPDVTSVIGNGPICENEDAIFTIVGTPNATVSYAITGVATTQTIVLDASGNGIITVAGAMATQTINLIDIFIGSCLRNLSNSATVVVNPLPNVTSITNNGPICSATNAVFTITGTPGSQVSYTGVSGLPASPVTLSASGSATVMVANATTNQTINLTLVTNPTTSCNSALTMTSTVVISAATTLTLISDVATENQTICENFSLSSINYQVLGTATNVVVTGLPTGVTSSYNAVTGVASISGTPSAPGVYPYTITTTGGCAPQATDNGVITVTIAPTVTIVNNTPTICDGEAMDVTITSDVPGATIYWTASAQGINEIISGNGVGPIVLNQNLTLQTGQFLPVDLVVTTYGVADCIGQTQTFTVRINPIPSVDYTVIDDSICSGETTQISLFSDDYPGASFSWTSEVVSGGTVSGMSNGSGSMITDTLTTANLTASTVVYHVTPTMGICAGTVVDITITVNPVPVDDLTFSGSINAICSGEMPNVTVASGNNNVVYEWSVQLNGVAVTGGVTSGVSTSNIHLIDHVLTTTGLVAGTAVYTFTPRLGDCLGVPRQYTQIVNPLPQPVLLDGSICVELSTGLVFQSHHLDSGIPNTANYDFNWYFNGAPIPTATQSTYDATEAGSYYVEVQNITTGCSNTSNTITVNEINNATDFTYTVTNAFTDNATITITVIDGNGSLLYQLDDRDLQDSNVFTGVSAGEHIVTVVDEKGCTYLEKSILVVDYPKFFTPNGDGYNETWNIFSLRGQSNTKIYIFDRYGKLIKQISPESQGWDGTFNGKQLPSADYWFTVEYEENQQKKVFKAHFSLKR